MLLVEDEEPVRRLMARHLSRAGWQVLAVETAEAALVAVPRLTAPDANPLLLVIADVALPGMDGTAMVRALRVTWPGLPVILVSGYGAAVVPLDLDRVVFLAKPFKPRELVRLARQAADAGG